MVAKVANVGDVKMTVIGSSSNRNGDESVAWNGLPYISAYPQYNMWSFYPSYRYAMTGSLGGTANNPSGSNVTWPTTGRHTDGSNFALADGHSKWFRPAAISPGLNNPTPTATQTSTGSAAGGLAAPTGNLRPFAATFSVQ